MVGGVTPFSVHGATVSWLVCIHFEQIKVSSGLSFSVSYLSFFFIHFAQIDFPLGRALARSFEYTFTCVCVFVSYIFYFVPPAEAKVENKVASLRQRPQNNRAFRPPVKFKCPFWAIDDGSGVVLHGISRRVPLHFSVGAVWVISELVSDGDNLVEASNWGWCFGYPAVRCMLNIFFRVPLPLTVLRWGEFKKSQYFHYFSVVFTDRTKVGQETAIYPAFFIP